MTRLVQPSGLLPGGVIALPAQFEREPRIELGWPGMDAPTPTLDIHLFDDSGSVSAAQGADPVGNRFGEAKRAIDLVAAWSMTTRGKVAVLHFDDPAGASGVHCLNDRRLRQNLADSLRVPLTGAGTSDLSPSLERAEQLAAEHPDHLTTLTIFSDFALTDHEPTAVLSRLLAYPGRVHAVVLGDDPPLDLEGADSVTITHLSAADPPGSFAAALLRSMTATRRGARRSVLHTPPLRKKGTT